LAAWTDPAALAAWLIRAPAARSQDATIDMISMQRAGHGTRRRGGVDMHGGEDAAENGIAGVGGR